MSELHRTIFISDLHLDAGEPLITNQFIKLLRSCDRQVDAIYILGDLFELWIGDDDNSDYHKKIFAEMRKMSQKGVNLYFIHGNRDFLISHEFANATGCKLLNEEEKISVYGVPVLLMHGDTLCKQDTKYQFARKFAQNNILQKLFLSLPLTFRRSIAQWARHKSSQHTKNTGMAIMDVTTDAVITAMQSHDVKFMIHGHTHRPNTHAVNLPNGDAGERIVLPAWHGGGRIYEWLSTGERRFRDLTEANLESSP